MCTVESERGGGLTVLTFRIEVMFEQIRFACDVKLHFELGVILFAAMRVLIG